MSFIAREPNNLMQTRDCANIVRMMEHYDHRVDNNIIRMDLVFEYCPFDLRKVIKNIKITFQLDEVKCFLRQILNGLHYMHERRV